MSKSLASFLDRRKKSTVKAAALLLQTEEAAQEKTKAVIGAEESQSEQQSDHDDEWKVSDDEATIYKNQAATSGSLMLTVRTVTGDGSEDRGMGNDTKPTQHVWQSIAEPVPQEEPAKEEEQKEEDTSKVWVPRFKSGSKNGFTTHDDVDLAEAARILAAKSEAGASKKTKKVKKKSASPKPAEDDDHTCYIKIKFNAFSVVSDKYRTFDPPHPSSSLDAEKVKAKYIERPAFTEVA
ncbi:hypothetical protein X943_003494 [Babesia divergens]|uniref:Uncharacterized protein n=1 Tax=Babesia divergens TaxID=32595 RepID=A0AAD9GDH2_BABDI|nr:hypothetical protein X943_003494 [Babesia divergens]